MNVLDILRYSSVPGWIYNLGELFFKKDDSFVGRMLHGLFDNPNPMEYITYRGDPNKYDWNGNVIGSVNDPSNEIQGYIDSYLKTITGAGPNGLQLWQAGREDSAYQRGVADMEKAGLNSALMYGNGAQPSASSAGAGSSVGISDLLQLAMLPMQMKMMEAQIKNVDADTANTEQNTRHDIQTMGYEADIQPLLLEAQEASNDVTREQARMYDSRIRVAEQQIRLLAAQTDNEYDRNALIQSETLLNTARAYEILELMPFRQNLMAAQTTAEQATAAFQFIQTVFQRKLIDGGYIDSMINSMKSQATSEAAKAALDSFRSRLRTGNLIQLDEGATWLQKLGAGIVNYPVAIAVNTLDVAGPVLGATIGASAAVKVAGMKASPTGGVSSLMLPSKASFDGQTFRTFYQTGGSR